MNADEDASVYIRIGADSRSFFSAAIAVLRHSGDPLFGGQVCREVK